MSEINPNTPVTEVATASDGSGKVNMDAGGGPLTFDELESVTTKKAPKKEAKKEEDDEAKSEKKKDLSSDSDKGKKPEPKKESEKPKAAKDSEKPEDQEKPARKTVKAKFAENELELDEETEIPVLVNGKEEMWTLKDLRADKSGKVAWDKQFSELHKMRKGLGTQEMKLQESAATIKAIFEEKDPNVKIFRMAQFAGVDPIQFRQKFFDDNISMLEKYYSMSDDERAADAKAFEAQYHKHRADTLESASKQEQAQKALKAKIDQIRASHQVSEDEFITRYDEITKMVKNGDLDKSQLTPEYIVETIQKDRMWDAAAEKFDSLGLKMSDEARNEKLFKLVEKAHKIGLSAKDLPEMVDELWGSKKAQIKVETKLKGNEEFRTGKKETVPQAKQQSSAPVFFDEMF